MLTTPTLQVCCPDDLQRRCHIPWAGIGENVAHPVFPICRDENYWGRAFPMCCVDLCRDVLLAFVNLFECCTNTRQLGNRCQGWKSSLQPKQIFVYIALKARRVCRTLVCYANVGSWEVMIASFCKLSGSSAKTSAAQGCCFLADIFLQIWRWERCTACWHIRHSISVRFFLPFFHLFSTSSSCVPNSQGEGFQEKRCWKLNLWPELTEGAYMYTLYADAKSQKNLRWGIMLHNVAGLCRATRPRCETHPSASCITSLPRWASDQITMGRNSLTRPLMWDSCTVPAPGAAMS